MTKTPPKQTESRVGRKELLTEDLAKRIARMIEQFPDTGIEVTWKNVIEQVKRRFGHKFHRNTLSQKEWGGKKLIALAFDDAEAVQKRLLKQTAPKYADNPRSRLRQVIADVQARELAMREQLEKTRARLYTEFQSLLDLRTPLHLVVEARTNRPPGKDGDQGGKTSRKSGLSLVAERVGEDGES